MATSPKQILANPNSRRMGKLSGLSIWKICFAVNAGSLTCLMPAKNKRSPTAEKINHLPNKSTVSAVPARNAPLKSQWTEKRKSAPLRLSCKTCSVCRLCYFLLSSVLTVRLHEGGFTRSAFGDTLPAVCCSCQALSLFQFQACQTIVNVITLSRMDKKT